MIGRRGGQLRGASLGLSSDTGAIRDGLFAVRRRRRGRPRLPYAKAVSCGGSPTPTPQSVAIAGDFESRALESKTPPAIINIDDNHRGSIPDPSLTTDGILCIVLGHARYLGG